MAGSFYMHITPTYDENIIPMWRVLVRIKEQYNSTLIYSSKFYALDSLQEEPYPLTDNQCKKLLLRCNHKNPHLRPQFKYTYSKKELTLSVKNDNTKIHLTLPYRE